MNNTLTTQRETIIKMLQDAGTHGVSSYEFTFDHKIKQCPTRVHELRKLGFNIISKPFKNSVIYVLSTEPKISEKQSMDKPKQYHEIMLEEMAQQESYVKDGKTYWRTKTPARQEALI